MSTTSSKPFVFHWGHAVSLFFVAFAIFILQFVYKASQREVDLVSKNYYEQEVNYQQEINATENAKLLSSAVKVEQSGKYINFQFPKDLINDKSKVQGSVYFYRPSDIKMDQTFPLQLDAEGRQQISAEHLHHGLYQARINFSVEGKKYQQNTSITVE